MQYQGIYDGLKTLEPDGQVPETRMMDASQSRVLVNRAIQNDINYRDWKRSRLKGLVDGNPPYKKSDLVAAGRGDECNVNWRIAKYFLSLAQGMIYDVFSQAETYATIELDPFKLEEKLGSSPKKPFSKDMVPEWSKSITAEFDRLQRQDREFDTYNQMSQGQCVLYGAGPMLFEDQLDWRPWAVENRSLFVPERAPANVNKWEWAAVVIEYSPTTLYDHIAVPANAKNWKVPATRRAIMAAHPMTSNNTNYQSWSYHQEMLKTGSYFYADQSKKIRCAHLYYREFPENGDDEGKISEVIINLDFQSTGGETDQGGEDYLYQALKRYDNWQQIIHPMYWMMDVSGLYYAGSGLGLEMYAGLDYWNRLFCRTADDAFAPKLFFKPTTASERERMSISQVGRYAILPAALDMVQQHMQPFLQDSIAMSREVQSLVSSNLSQYRSQSLQKAQGNPATATQIQYEASEQAKMGATQLARIYEQYDWLYAEKYRRATNPNLTASVRGGAEALEFVKRCERRGVPKEALQCIESVKATRAVGQGSAFLRQQALEFLLGLMQVLPEQGRENLIRDVIAARTGQSHVDRYAPRPDQQDSTIAAQESDAMQQVASMKIGVPAVVVPTQNPAIYAQIFLESAEKAAQSIQQGGADPHEPLAFIQLAIPATQSHLQRMAGDKTREGALKQMGERISSVAAFADKVMAQLAQQQQEQQQAAQQMAMMQSGQDPETQIGLAKVQTNAALKAKKQQMDFALKAERQRGDLALAANRQAVENQLKDATTAHDIRLSAAESQAKAAQKNGKV